MDGAQTLAVFVVSGVMNVILGVFCVYAVEDSGVAWLGGLLLLLVGAGLIAVGTL